MPTSCARGAARDERELSNPICVAVAFNASAKGAMYVVPNAVAALEKAPSRMLIARACSFFTSFDACDDGI